MGDTNPNIQRVSFEEIQEFKDLDLFNLTWEQTNGRQVLLAYDPRSQTFGFTYAAPGADGGNQNISLFYGYSSIIADFIDNGSLGSRPSINGFDNGDGILTMNSVGSVMGFSFYDVEINPALDIDRYVFRTSFLANDGYTPVKGTDYFDGVNGISAYTSALNGGFVGTEAQWIASLKGLPGDPGASALTDQKFIVYPADFVGTNYTILDADKGKSLVIINGATAVTITIPVALQLKMQVGFIRDGAGEVTLTGAAGMTLKNAINGFRIKDRYDQAFIEQGISTSEYYVFGTTKV